MTALTAPLTKCVLRSLNRWVAQSLSSVMNRSYVFGIPHHHSFPSLHAPGFHIDTLSLGRIMADLELISYVTMYRPIDPFRLSCCCTATTNQSWQQSSTTPPKRTWGKNVLTLTLCVLRADRTESFWIATDLVKCLVHSICLLRLRKKLQHLAGCCCYDLYIIFGWRVVGFCLHLWSKWAQSTYVCVCTCRRLSARVCVLVCVSFTLLCMISMSSNVLLCYWFLCEYFCIPCFCLIKWQSPLSRQTCTINSICVGTCTETCEHVCQVTHPS